MPRGSPGFPIGVRPVRNGAFSADQEAEVAEWIESGPDLERDGVVRWRCRDLQERIKREFQISFHERTIGKLLAKLVPPAVLETPG